MYTVAYYIYFSKADPTGIDQTTSVTYFQKFDRIPVKVHRNSVSSKPDRCTTVLTLSESSSNTDTLTVTRRCATGNGKSLCRVDFAIALAYEQPDALYVSLRSIILLFNLIIRHPEKVRWLDTDNRSNVRTIGRSDGRTHGRTDGRADGRTEA